MQANFKSVSRQLNNTLTKYIFNIEKGPTDCTALFILQLVVEITNSFYMFSVERRFSF